MAEEKKLETKAIKGGRLIDGTGAEPIENATVIIEGSKIKAVGKDVEVPKGSKVIDATGKTVMPGLIDSHMHHWGLKTDVRSVELVTCPKELALIKSIYDSKALLEAGFTTVKDCGGMNGVFLKSAVGEGTLTGLPRIVAAGYFLSQTSGLEDTPYFPVECSDARTTKHLGMGVAMTLLCDGVDECIKATRYALRQGADFIKISTTSGLSAERGDPSHTEFNLDEIKAIVQTAAQGGTFVSAHAFNSRGAENAILGGVKTIDHANEISDEVVKLAKEKGVVFVSTLAAFRQIMDHGVDGGMPPWEMEKCKVWWRPCIESYKKMRKAGAILAAGTDYLGTPVTKFGTNAIELELLVNYCGFAPMDAIVAATKNGAMACYMADKTGTIELGKFADIIVLDGDPLADIKILQNVEKIRMVILEGKIEIDRGV